MCRFLDRTAEERDAHPYPVPTVRALAPRFGGSSLFYLSSRGTGDGLWRSGNGEHSKSGEAPTVRCWSPPAPSPDGQRVSVVLRRNGNCVWVYSLRMALRSGFWRTLSKCKVPRAGRRMASGLSPAAMTAQARDYSRFPWTAARRCASPKARRKILSGRPTGRLIVYTGPIVGILAPIQAIAPGWRPSGPARKSLCLTEASAIDFYRDSKSLIYMQGDIRSQDFWSLDLATKKSRQLTRLNNRAAMRTFDIRVKPIAGATPIMANINIGPGLVPIFDTSG